MGAKNRFCVFGVALGKSKLAVTVVDDIDLIILGVFRLSFVVLCSDDESRRVGLINPTATCLA